MKCLGSLLGRGNIELKGQLVGAIDYRIDVWFDGQRKTATGSSPGADDVLWKIFNKGEAVLQLQNGGTARFFVTRLGSGDAELQFSGPIPGF